MESKHAQRRRIKDVNYDDNRVQVTGYVKEIPDKKHFVLDDRGGQIKVNIEQIDDFKFKKDDLINVIGDIDLKTDGEKIIQADIIQDMSKLNFKYYLKIYELKRQF